MNELLNQQMINTGSFSPQAQQVANGVFQPQDARNQSVAYVNPMSPAPVNPMAKTAVDQATGMPIANPNQIVQL